MNSTALYPALFELATRELHPLSGAPQFAAGRSQSADLPLLDSRCSRQQFQLVRHATGYTVQPLSENCPTLCNGIQLLAARDLEHGDLLQAGSLQFIYLKREDDGACRKRVLPQMESEATQIGRPVPADSRERTVYATSAQISETLDSGHHVIVAGQILIGRDSARVQIPLPHSQVSRIHAQITVRKHGVELVDLNSANGTFVNGARVLRAVQLRAGDRIHIGPYSLVFTGRELLSDSRQNNVELRCHDLTRVVRTRDGGQRLVILDRVSLAIQPREFICLLGPSGSGKSTLLAALSARMPADSGSVTINGENLYANFEAIKRDIAVVPQKDVLHDGLRVRTALTWTARLRLPPDTASEEIAEAVDEMLRTVGLEPRADARICDLSGGQLKRACVANEIVNRPSLLFLDEATSGLDEQTDAEMMRLFRKIADGGKTVVCVTHNLANVEETCHRVVVLAEGGKLAFVGTPAETREHFRVEKLGAIYEVLKTRTPDEWRDQFLRSAASQTMKKSMFEGQSDSGGATNRQQSLPAGEQMGIIARQASLLALRYLQIMWSDRRSLALILGQCLLVAFLVVTLFGDVSTLKQPQLASYSASIMFLLAISSVWFGCNNAAREIVKEAAIYVRERDVNLQVPAYVASKCAVLWGISILQVFLLCIITKVGTGVDLGTEAVVMLCSLAIAGTAVGLLISAISKTSDMAISTVPLVLVPQIILSGAIAKVEGISEWMAQIAIVLYWGYGGLVASFPAERAELLGYKDWTFWGPLLVVLVHSVLCLTVTTGILLLSASREGSGRGRLGWIMRARLAFLRF
jgi:ABC-type multidrug transport system ATPase subunit/pSer/pThr/pTyr-binding forkhead associated (FHA) protein